MQFLLGDAITLGVVLAVLVAFRMSDQNNRTLNKVRKYAETVRSELDAIVEQRAAALRDIAIEVDVHQQAARKVLERSSEIESEMDERLGHVKVIDQRLSEYDDSLGRLVEMTRRTDENLSRLQEESAFVDEVGRKLRDTEKQVSSLQERLGGIVQDFSDRNRAEIASVSEEFSNAAQERYRSFIEQVDSAGAALDQWQQDFDRRVRDYQQRFADTEQEYSDRIQQIAADAERLDGAIMEQVRKRIDGHAADLDNQLSGVESRLEQAEERLAGRADAINERIGGLAGSLDRATEEVQHQVFARLEERLQSYEASVNERLDRVATVTSDIDTLESSLTESLHEAESRAQSQLDEAVDALRVRYEDEQNRIEQQMTGLRDGLDRMQGELDSLTTDSGERASAQLQQFEERFFADLGERASSFEDAIRDTHLQFDSELSALSESVRSEARELEQRLSSEFRATFAQVQSGISTQVDNLGRSVELHEQDIRVRLEQADELGKRLEERVQQELSEAGESIRQDAQRRLQAFGERGEQQVKAAEQQLKQRITDLLSRLGELEGSVADRLRNVSEDVDGLRQSVDSRIEAARKESDAAVAAARSDQLTSLAGLRAELEAMAEQLRTDTDADRGRVREDLTQIEQTLAELTETLSSVSQDSVARISTAHREAQEKAEEMARRLERAGADKLQEFRGSVRELREELESSRAQSFADFDERSEKLRTEIKAIEKRQRAYIAQSRLFERADSLKEELRADVEAARQELARVDEQRTALKELEAQFTRVKRLGDDAGQKLQKFMGEKRRIDLIEEDYRRLMSLGQQVSVKLEQVTAADDQLQEMQVALRQLNELEQDVQSRFTAIEKKQHVLDVTSDGIGKTFDQLQSIERQIGEIRGSLDDLPQRISTLDTQVKQLERGKGEVDRAVRELGTIEQTVGDLENRMTELRNAREWLARTESRLNELSTRADEQLNLLGSLMKAGPSAPRDRSTAPPESAREMVVKLAQQGWKIDDIVRATKMARGEVELILEFSRTA